MNTALRRLLPDADGLAEAAAALRRGELAAHPTETVYGIGADPFNPEAVERLIRAKGRDASKGFVLIIADREQLSRVAATVSPAARRCMDAFWPGPLSLLLDPAPGLAPAVLGGHPKVCVRMPGLEAARGLCAAFGGPVVSTSANAAGEAPAQEPGAIRLPGVAICLDAGPLPPSLPSTILDPDAGRILREGAVTAASIEAAVPGLLS